MRRSFLIAIVAGVLDAFACATNVPKRAGVAPGTPYVSWVIMSGDRENPDQDFVCQSDPPDDCVVPASRPDTQVFSDLHVYYHAASAETRYTGSIQVGYFQGSSGTYRMQTNMTVKKDESIRNQSVAAIVTSNPGNYEVTFDLVATSLDSGKSEPIRQRLPVVVK